MYSTKNPQEKQYAYPDFFGATYPGNAPGPSKQRLELFLADFKNGEDFLALRATTNADGCEAGCSATLMRYAAPGLEIVISPRAPHRIAPDGATSCRRTRTPPSRHAKTPALRASRKVSIREGRSLLRPNSDAMNCVPPIYRSASLPFVFVNNCKVANKCKRCFGDNA